MKIVQILRKLSRDTPAEVYYAGKCARDIIRRKKPNKVEILVKNLPFNSIVKYLKHHFNRLEVKKSESSISIHCDQIDAIIQLPKKRGRYSPYYTLREDADHRQFSVNAMFIPLNKRNKIVDHYGGRNCIKDRRIKLIGRNDISIQRNPLLMMRSIALASELNYKLDNNLFYSIKRNSALIEDVPKEDIRPELNKIVLANKPSKYLKIMYTTGLMNIVLPELSMCVGVKQNEKYHKFDVFEHCVLACDFAELDLTIRLAALLHDVGKPQTRNEIFKKGHEKITFYNHEVVSSKLARKILRRLRYSKEEVSKITDLIYNHMYNYEPDKWTDSAVRRFIKRARITESDLGRLDRMPIFLLRKADRAANGLGLSEISPRQYAFEKKIKDVYIASKALHIKDLDIDGTLIMELFNLKPGPTIGHILNYLLSLVIEDQKMNKRSILIEEASKYLSKALK